MGRRNDDDAALAPHERYDLAAEAAADTVIRRYSTSFGTASRLLAEPVRTHVRNVYAMVRVADEIVDAPRPADPTLIGADPGVKVRARILDALEEDVLTAMSTGHSANLVVHAFARTARWAGITAEIVVPFFASMRTDLERSAHDEASFAEYVHGSAEVVGLMCLRIFVRELPASQENYTRLAAGAMALGAGFQKVNFLRDIAADVDELGRSYFPGLTPDDLDVAARDRILDDVDADLALAATVLTELPASSRRAVAAAHALFAALSRQLRATDPATIRGRRVRVPTPRKAGVVGVAVAGALTDRLWRSPQRRL